jgi:hypothetical protein
MLGLVDDFVNAETTSTLLSRVLYHIPHLRAEKGSAQRRKNGNAIANQVDIVRINERNSSPFFCGSLCGVAWDSGLRAGRIGVLDQRRFG